MVLPSDPLERVRTGMQVVDTTGHPLGQVARVQLPSPRVVHPPDSDIIDNMASVVPAPPEMSEADAQFDIIGPSPLGHDPAGLPDLPDPWRAHLEQVGFIEVDGPDLDEVERFVPADHLQEVGEDRVIVRPRAT